MKWNEAIHVVAANRQHRYDLYLIAYRSIRPQHPFIALLRQTKYSKYTDYF